MGLPTFYMMMIMFSFSLESFQPRQIGVTGDCDGDYCNCEDDGGGIWKDGDSAGGDDGGDENDLDDDDEHQGFED